MEIDQERDNNNKPVKKNKSCLIILLNLGAMALIGVALVFLALSMLRAYTRHNQAFPMPDVIGMTQDDARKALKKSRLRMEITDSVYNESMPPGVVLESVPKAGAMIKKKRTVFLIVNNTEVKHIAVPNVYEISRRQAEALLKGSGFVNVTIKYIPGTFHDLSLYLKDSKGRVLKTGDRVPYNMALVLEVSNSELLEQAVRDSLAALGIESGVDVPTTVEPEQTPDEPDNSGEDWF